MSPSSASPLISLVQSGALEHLVCSFIPSCRFDMARLLSVVAEKLSPPQGSRWAPTWRLSAAHRLASTPSTSTSTVSLLGTGRQLCWHRRRPPCRARCFCLGRSIPRTRRQLWAAPSRLCSPAQTALATCRTCRRCCRYNLQLVPSASFGGDECTARSADCPCPRWSAANGLGTPTATALGDCFPCASG